MWRILECTRIINVDLSLISQNSYDSLVVWQRVLHFYSYIHDSMRAAAAYIILGFIDCILCDLRICRFGQNYANFVSETFIQDE